MTKYDSDLHGKLIGSELPQTIGMLTALKVLDLADTNLNGTIPGVSASSLSLGNHSINIACRSYSFWQ
jgi:hypothetical protein